jgi:hypothetical protein
MMSIVTFIIALRFIFGDVALLHSCHVADQPVVAQDGAPSRWRAL